MTTRMKDQDLEKKLFDMKLPQHDWVDREVQETAWKEVMLEIDARQKSTQSKWWWAAASIILMIGMGWYLWPSTEIRYATGDAEKLNIRLADDSRVTLNHQSNLTVSSDFDQSKREVQLKGEAFFDVARNTEKPFIIQMDNRQVKVLGTSFLVAHKRHTTSVSVRSGKVLLANGSESITLIKGQKAEVDKKGEITAAVWDENEFAWYTGDLSFDNKSLSEVAMILSNLSQKPVVVSNKISECKLSLKINYERIEEVFDIIAETLEIKWNEEATRIYFDGQGC